MVSDEVRELRAIISAQSKDLEELREFSEAERRQRDLNLADQAKTIADMELRTSQLVRDAEAYRLDLQRLQSENAELRVDTDRLQRNESLAVSQKTLSNEIWTQTEGGYGGVSNYTLPASKVKPTTKENASIRLTRKQMAGRFKLLAAYNLANVRKRRFWDPQSHGYASFVCSIVDNSYETTIP